MSNYQEAKSHFINSYETSNSIDNISELVYNIVIPHFNLFACDLSEIIDLINSKYSIQSESMDFIELVFNPNLYKVILEQKDNTNDEYIHYLIVLVEYIKLEKYTEMKSRLETILSNDKISNTILSDGIRQASNERIDNCKERITNTINDLKNNYSNFVLSLTGIKILLETNNIVL